MNAPDLKIYLHGLIKRDVSCPAPLPDDHPYWQTPAGQRCRAENAARKAAWDNDDIRPRTAAAWRGTRW